MIEPIQLTNNGDTLIPRSYPRRYQNITDKSKFGSHLGIHKECRGVIKKIDNTDVSADSFIFICLRCDRVRIKVPSTITT